MQTADSNRELSRRVDCAKEIALHFADREVRKAYLSTETNFRVAVSIVMTVVSLSSADEVSAQTSIAPSGAFVQAGTWGDTHQLSTGLNWDWHTQWSVASGQLSGYWELSLSEWSYPSMDGRREAWLGQVGLVPTFRYRPDSGNSPWYLEGGVGASFMTTVYETQRKRFSTSFNFADHLGIGRNFGVKREHEVALRFEHFSNAGIKHPNPGQNFVELRYTYRFP